MGTRIALGCQPKYSGNLLSRLKGGGSFKRKAAFVVLHSDGYIMPILPDIVDAGVDAYQ